MKLFLLVCSGGALGTGVRYLVGRALVDHMGPRFPWGTLTVNLVGSFILAIVATLATRTSWMTADLRAVLGVGLMGGFTTYSSFNQETLLMLEAGAVRIALAYIGATLVGALVMGALGIVLTRWLVPT